MPPGSSKNMGVARFDASSRASIKGSVFGEPGVPSGSLTARHPSTFLHDDHRCRIGAALPTGCLLEAASPYSRTKGLSFMGEPVFARTWLKMENAWSTTPHDGNSTFRFPHVVSDRKVGWPI
jgi:hypothetical protein